VTSPSSEPAESRAENVAEADPAQGHDGKPHEHDGVPDQDARPADGAGPPPHVADGSHVAEGAHAEHPDDEHPDSEHPDDESDDEHTDGAPKRARPLSHELPVLLAVAVVLALLLKAFVVQAFYIPSGSMEQTLLIKDRVLVNKLVYRFRDVHRGEIVVFNGSGTGFTQSESEIPPPTNAAGRVARSVQRALGVGAPGERDFVKRVIGVGGDTVACCDAAGRVTVNGVALNEPYVFENNPLDGGRTFAPFKVPPGDLWVMGDHRGDSGDSRINGPIPQDRVIGRAFVRVWPVNRFAFLRVPATFSTSHAGGPVTLGLVGVPTLLLVRRRRRRPTARRP
jgi:signal peptidase I